MKISKLKLVNFRNYENLKINFSDKLNIIYGENGSGKSNLVEAIYLLALTKSFRITNDKYLINKGKDSTTIEGKITKNNDESDYKVKISTEGKKVEIDNNKINKISEYITKIQVIVFYPSNTELINDSPSERRKLLNIEISQIFKEYLILLNNYNKILKQRNAYLKQLYLYGNASREYLDILTKKLVEYGKRIHKYRLEFLENLNQNITKVYKDIFESGELKIKYKSSYNRTERELLEIYRKYYSKEMAAGKTLIGIHHDDFEFILDGNNIKEWGSQGQLKNAILSFKISEVKLIKDILKEYPILILDDLFSELDERKIYNILNILDDNVQTFITTTELKSIPINVVEKSNIYHIQNGEIMEEKDE